MFRALQLARFTTTTLFDTDEGIRAALARVPQARPRAVLAAIEDPATEAAYQADRALVAHRGRQPDRVPGQGREHRRRRPLHGAVAALRAPRRAQARGRRLPAGRGLRRRDRQPRPDAGAPRRRPRTSPRSLAAFPYPLTTREVAARHGAAPRGARRRRGRGGADRGRRRRAACGARRSAAARCGTWRDRLPAHDQREGRAGRRGRRGGRRARRAARARALVRSSPSLTASGRAY